MAVEARQQQGKAAGINIAIDGGRLGAFFRRAQSAWGVVTGENLPAQRSGHTARLDLPSTAHQPQQDTGAERSRLATLRRQGHQRRQGAQGRYRGLRSDRATGATGATGAAGATGPQGPAGPNTVAYGSLAAPSIFSSSTDTGIFSPGGGKIALAQDGQLFLHNIGTNNTALGINALQNGCFANRGRSA